MDLHQYITAIKERLEESSVVAFVEIVDERVLLMRGYFRARLSCSTFKLGIQESKPLCWLRSSQKFK